MRIVFMGTRDIAVPVLRALLEAGRPAWQVVGVFTQPDRPAGRSTAPLPPPVKLLAQQAGIPVFQPASLRDEAAQATLAALAPEVGVVASYAQLLPRAVLRLPPAGWLNVHPSLLPRHRGPSPVVAAILAGDAETGVSIIKLVRAMDAGPIVDQVCMPILPDDSGGTLTARLGELGARRLTAVLEAWVAGGIAPRPQEEQGATYSRLLRTEDGRLDWSRPASELARQVRAYDPWPGTFSTWQRRRLRVLAARAIETAGDEAEVDPGAAGQAGAALATLEAASKARGTVLRLVGGGRGAALLVATGSGALALERLQLEGRRALPADDFVRGQPGILGARLGIEASGGAGTARDAGAS